MNSILQCLSNTLELKDYCLRNIHRTDLNNNCRNNAALMEGRTSFWAVKPHVSCIIRNTVDLFYALSMLSHFMVQQYVTNCQLRCTLNSPVFVQLYSPDVLKVAFSRCRQTRPKWSYNQITLYSNYNLQQNLCLLQTISLLQGFVEGVFAQHVLTGHEYPQNNLNFLTVSTEKHYFFVLELCIFSIINTKRLQHQFWVFFSILV